MAGEKFGLGWQLRMFFVQWLLHFAVYRLRPTDPGWEKLTLAVMTWDLEVRQANHGSGRPQKKDSEDPTHAIK